MDFQQSKPLGGRQESFVSGLLDEASIPNEANLGQGLVRLSGWDIRCQLNGSDFTVEVKFDAMESRTGNVAVEYHNTDFDTPSGILATTSTLWVVVLQQPQTAWVCRVSDLKTHFLSEPCLRDIPHGGDGNASLRLYRRKDLFEKLFHRLDDLPPWERRETFVNLLKENRVDNRTSKLANAV